VKLSEHSDRPSLRQWLHDMADTLPEEGLPVSALMQSLGREGLLLLAIILCLPFLLPVSIPGVSTIFGALILLIGVAITFNTAPWLPGRIARYPLARARLHDILELGAKWVERLERISCPRLTALTRGPMQNLHGALLVLGAGLLMVPLGLVPFSNTLPALGIIFTAVALIQRDGGCTLIGIGFNLLTIIYFGLIFALGATVVLEGLRRFVPGLG
jgi:hypothetical protein